MTAIALGPDSHTPVRVLLESSIFQKDLKKFPNVCGSLF
jgi:hypothetical protein